MLSFGLSYVLCIAAQILYPTYASFKALSTVGSADDSQWLTYWVVYAFLSTIEAVAGPVLQWFPLYYEAKLCLVVWLITPHTQGAKLLYDQYISPFLVKYGKHLDPAFEKATKVLESKYMGEAAKLAEKQSGKFAEEAFKYAAANVNQAMAAKGGATKAE